MFIENVSELVTSLKSLRDVLHKLERPESKIAQKCIHQIREMCVHAKADRKGGQPIGRCPDCLKKFHNASK